MLGEDFVKYPMGYQGSEEAITVCGRACRGPIIAIDERDVSILGALLEKRSTDKFDSICSAIDGGLYGVLELFRFHALCESVFLFEG